jgi:hypothetical protein
VVVERVGGLWQLACMNKNDGSFVFSYTPLVHAVFACFANWLK